LLKSKFYHGNLDPAVFSEPESHIHCFSINVTELPSKLFVLSSVFYLYFSHKRLKFSKSSVKLPSYEHCFPDLRIIAFADFDKFWICSKTAVGC